MNCPKCFEPLRIADRQGIEIDFCPDCRGVWLDRGELDKIIERTLRADIPRSSYDDSPRYEPQRDYKRDNYHKKKSYKKKKAKHVLEEIFDFFD